MTAIQWVKGPVLTAACFAVLAAAVWDAAEQAPLAGLLFHWNDTRAARCVAAGRGLDLYAGPDEPALDGHIYGPVGFWMCSPAALASSPSSAVKLATALSAVYLTAPVWLLLGLRAKGERRETQLALQAGLIVCFSSYWFIFPGAAWNPHIDAQAIGLMGFACWAAFRLAEAPEKRLWLVLAALSAGAAVWTKQTSAPILGFAPVLLWLRGERKVAGFAAFATFLSCVGWGLAAGTAYGMRDMLFTMFELPRNQRLVPGVILFDHERLADLLPPAVLAVIGAALLQAGAKFPRRGLALAVFAAAVAPFAIAGRIKIEGFSNNLIAPIMLLAFAAAVVLLETVRDPDLADSWKAWARTVATCVLLLMAARTAAHVLIRALDRAARQEQPRSETALRFVKAHPGQAYFPTRPLAALYAAGHWHSTEQAVRTRVDAGFATAQLSLPRDLQYVVLEGPSPDVMKLFADFEATDSPELPGWLVFERATR